MKLLLAFFFTALFCVAPVEAHPVKCKKCKKCKPPVTCPVTPTPTPSPACPTATPSATQPPLVPIPELAAWKSNMLTYGAQHCARYDLPLSFDQHLADTYYDAEHVFYQIQTYTGVSSWFTCAQKAEAVYRDQYVLPNGGNVPGYWNFTHGLRDDYQATGDLTSQNAVNLLSHNAAYAADHTPPSATIPWEVSREVAYAIHSYLDAATIGSIHPHFSLLVDHAYGHLNQWFVSQTASYVRPFMVGLTAHALIHYDEFVGGDPRTIPALKTALEWLWVNTWLPNAEAFMYTNITAPDGSGGQEPAPDLNLLIAPAYAWLWKQTGESKWQVRGDEIFAGGVKFSYLSYAKQFNQNYRWSFDFVKWRSE